MAGVVEGFSLANFLSSKQYFTVMEVRTPEGSLQIAILALVSLGLVGYGGYSFVDQSRALSSAVEVNATVDSTGVVEDSQRRGGVEYRPQVSYSYSFEGENFSSSNVYPSTLSKSFGTREEAETVLDDYSEGSEVTAYVRPGSPDKAFLVDERSNKPFLFIGIGALMASFAAYSFISG